MDCYEHTVTVNGEEVSFGYSEKDRQIGLFGGSFIVTYPKYISLDDAKKDIAENYEKYKADNQEFFYRANGFYD